jgi:hypothetical protein
MKSTMKNTHPFLVMAILASSVGYGQNLSAYTNEMHLNFKGQALPNSNNLPVIQWVNPSLEYTASQENRISFKAEVKSFQPIKELQVVVGERVSGVVYTTKNFELTGDPKEYTIQEVVNLPGGSNYIEITATNNQGAKVSSYRNIVVGAGAITDAVMIDRKDHALIFVTDKYDNWDDLVNPIDDGRSIAKELGDKYGFEVEVVENATVEAVWEK